MSRQGVIRMLTGAVLAALAILIYAELRKPRPLNQPPPHRSCVTADCKW